MQLFLFLCNTRPSNSAAMCFSHRKLSETGLRIVGAFLKVMLSLFLPGCHMPQKGVVPWGLMRLVSANQDQKEIDPDSHDLWC